MGKTHTLIEIEAGFDKLCRMVRAGHIGKEELNMQLFSELGFSRGEAIVVAWLMNHKEEICSMNRMCRDLKLNEGAIADIMNKLFVKNYVVIIGEGSQLITVDVSDCIPYYILDQEAMRESRRAEKRSRYTPIWQRFSDVMSDNADALFDSLSDGDG